MAQAVGNSLELIEVRKVVETIDDHEENDREHQFGIPCLGIITKSFDFSRVGSEALIKIDPDNKEIYLKMLNHI